MTVPAWIRKPAPAAALLAGVIALVTAGCGPSSPGGRSILIVTMDTTRADHVGAYGSPLGLTPNVDALAAQGVLYEDAYAPMPQTLPSHASLFTGLQPRLHGALENTYRLDTAYSTLAEQAEERGYATGAFVAALVLDQETGIDQGFQHFDIPGGAWNAAREGHPPQRTADEVTASALRWADDLDGERPYLLWAHYYDPHGDSAAGFDPPAKHLEAVSRKAVRQEVNARASGTLAGAPLDKPELIDFWRAYAAEIRFMDEQIGRLLDGLRQRGLLDDTLVVLVGDHGEGLYEHGIKAHGVYLWEELHRVPLIIVHPDGDHAGARIRGRAQLVDVHPTVARLAFGADGLPAASAEDLGIDLWGATGPADLPDRPVFLERPHFDRERVKRRMTGVPPMQPSYGFLTAVLRGQHKLVLHPDDNVQLFDLGADPHELNDLAAQEPDLRADLERLLRSWMDAHDHVGMPGESMELSPERRAALEALGYL